MTQEVVLPNGGGDGQMPHFVLVPMMAQGHTIPMVDLARLLATRGATVSFITTPVNAARIRPIIDSVKTDGLPIRFVELEFPCAKVGLPDGYENIDILPSRELHLPFLHGVDLLREPLELYLQDVKPAPNCMIVDFCASFIAEVTRRLNILRIIFHGPSCFYLLCTHNIREHKVYDGVGENETVVVPDMPQRIEIKKALAPGWMAMPSFDEFRHRAMEAEASADGVVMNTFYELEPEFIERYKKVIKKPVWPLGPFSLYNKDVTSMAQRGRKPAIDEHQVLSWLESKERKSVMFVNFGSLVRMKPLQLIEIGCALEESKQPFIWVIKEADKCPEIEKWMSEGFEERTKERGLVITGWAPQVVILTHTSVAGFMTHCGWNSMLEAISAGVPMITWPHFSDQFLNEKLVVEVLQTAVSTGVMVYCRVPKDEVLVTREQIVRAIASLMDGGEEGEERRKRAAEFAEKAQKAMKEKGSSYNNLSLLIKHTLKCSKCA